MVPPAKTLLRPRTPTVTFSPGFPGLVCVTPQMAESVFNDATFTVLAAANRAMWYCAPDANPDCTMNASVQMMCASAMAHSPFDSRGVGAPGRCDRHGTGGSVSAMGLRDRGRSLTARVGFLQLRVGREDRG